MDKREMESSTIKMIDWAKPLAFQDLYPKVTHSTQTAAPTYVTGETVLEFNTIVRQGQFVRSTDREFELKTIFPLIWGVAFTSIIFLVFT